MAAKRSARRPSSGDSKELGGNGGNEGSDDDEDEESGKSGDTAMSAEPKEMPLKRAEEPSSPSPEDVGAQGSGEASPARSAPRGGVKRVKKPPPASQEEDEAESSGGASPARGLLPDDSADAGHNKRGATPKRGEKRSPPPRQGDERPEKRAAGPAGETVAASAPRRKKKSKRSAEKDRRKKKKKKQLRKALTKPKSPPQLLELELNDDREDTPSLPDIAQEDEHNGRETAEQEQEQSSTSPPEVEHRAREEEHQEKKITEQEHASDTSPPHDKDMHIVHGEEQQEKEVANQEHADDTSPPKDNHSVDEGEQQGEGILQQEQPSDTSPSQEENRAQEDEETGAQVNGKALQERNPPSTKPHSSQTEKKPAVERSWSYDDELKILNALVVHAKSHNGALPDSSHLLANLTFDKTDANEEKLTDKIRKLRTWYRKILVQGCPSDDLGRRLFKLSEILWGQVDEDERVEPTSRDFSVLSKLYPHLAKEVKAYAETHSSRDLIMAMFMTIGDEKARDLDAKCKKQQIEAFKLELGQASLINELLFALSSLTCVKF
ncbi:nucleolin 2-like [Miscanthus floridulus]|uniref:nucleolin 2-like n=1 Tax=Miscanthus floridulus TaxID=154761 RepID=UPI003457B355